MRLLLLMAIGALGGGAPPAGAQADRLITAFETDRLTIETVSGERLAFQIELARSPREQAQGLMFRREMSADAGMLFLYPAEQVVSMWMKNTLIPLDMLFIEGDGRIAKVVQRTVPLSTATISSGRPVRAVLELNGGTAARLGIAAGDRVLHPAFDGAR